MKSGTLGKGTRFTVPINNQGVAKFTAKVDSFNRDARRNQMGLILTELDPFPGLHDGSGMHKDNAALVPRPAEDLTTGATVAVEATVATYDFISKDGVRRF